MGSLSFAEGTFKLSTSSEAEGKTSIPNQIKSPQPSPPSSTRRREEKERRKVLELATATSGYGGVRRDCHEEKAAARVKCVNDF